MKLVKVDWYGGKRRDGRINDFGYVNDAAGKSYRIQEKMLSTWLKQHAPQEDDLAVLQFDAKAKIIQVQALQEVEVSCYRELLDQATDHIFLTKAWHTLDITNWEIAQLSQLSQATENKLLRARLMECMWGKLSAEDKKESILQLELSVLPAFMLKDVLNQQVAFDAELESILVATLEKMNIQQSVAYELLDQYPAIQNYVKLLPRDVVKGLQDARFVEGIIAQIKCTSPNTYLAHANHLATENFTVQDIPISYWFSIPSLYKKVQSSPYYESYVQFFAQYEAQTGQIDKSAHYVRSFLQTKNPSYVTWSYFPKSVLLYPTVQSLVPATELFWIYNEGTYDALAFLSVIERLTEAERNECLPELHEQYKKDERFERVLPPIDRAKQLYKRLPIAFEENFVQQEPLVKNYLIYEMTKQFQKSPQPWLTAEKIAAVGNAESHPMIKALLYLLHRGITKTYHSEEQIFHLIEKEIQRQLNENLPLDTLALLPRCPFTKQGELAFCEAKKITYYDEQEGNKEVIYCPKTRSSCHAILQAVHMKEGAHLGARNELPIDYWTVQEMFSFAGMEPFREQFFEQKKSGHAQTYYVNKIAGWVNRIITIRERLKCSKCNKAFKVQYDFSKRFEVAYNATHFSCVDAHEESGHDTHIYLSHCRCCKKLIDSRESKYKISNDGMGWYICLHCGSAEENKAYDAPWKKTPYYEQGDICPKCNHREQPMAKKMGASKWYRCKQCQHEIKTTL